MYCKNCGKEIIEDSNFCLYCGNKLNKEKESPSHRAIEDIKTKEIFHKKNSNKYIILSIMIILLTIAIISSLPIERTISKDIPYQEAIYKTIYKTETVTKYKTVFYGTLKDTRTSFFGLKDESQIWTFDNALSWNKEYTRQGGSAEYKFTITNMDGTESYYYDIDWWDINQKQMPYTETVNVPEQVIDRYETKYKTEYINVRKPLISWILGLE